MLYDAHRSRSETSGFFFPGFGSPEDAPTGNAGWSSPVARQAHNLKVVGSNPAPATKFASTASASSLSASPLIATTISTRFIARASRRSSQLHELNWISRTSSNGGEGGIRTPGTLASTSHFECDAIDHSATSPQHRAPARRAALVTSQLARRKRLRRQFSRSAPAALSQARFSQNPELRSARDAHPQPSRAGCCR